MKMGLGLWALGFGLIGTACGPAQTRQAAGSPSPTPPAADPATPAADPAPAKPEGYEAELQFCVDETNRYRKQHGKPPVTRSAELETCALAGAIDDSQTRRAHGHFIDTAGCNISFAENEIPWWDISFGNGTVRGTIEAGLKMMHDEGPGGGHYENMLGAYTELGCGIVVNGQEITIVQDYK